MRFLQITCPVCLLAFLVGAATEGHLAEGQVVSEPSPSGTAFDGRLGSTMTLKNQGRVAKRNEAEKKLLVVRPAAESVPALAHRLWLPRTTLKPGSAQLYFSRALLMWRNLPAEFRQKVENWTTEEVKVDPQERQQAVESLRNVFHEIHLLATSEHTGYDHRLRDLRGPEMYMYLLPEVQQSRSLARVLRIRIDHQLHAGDVEGAIESLRDGFRLASFIGQGETLVQKLVGLAIENVMLDEVERLVEHGQGPNMYWPLATLPRPMINVRESIQFELSSIHRILPVLEEAETADYGDEYWNRAWAQVLTDFDSLSGGDSNSKLAFAILGVAAAGPAKERLVASGLDPQWVEDLPALRAVLMDASREIRRVADNLDKANYLPGILGNEIGLQEEENLQNWIAENSFRSGGAAIVGLLFPAVQAAKSAGLRQEFLINRLMTIEALRMHAAAHGGQLPASLDQLDPVPALPNPFTGKAFRYHLESKGDSQLVTLQADVPPGSQHLKQIQVRIESL